MNTQYVKYAVEIERAGSVTAAARKLYMAQPNLSKAIKDLETDLGYTIFKRTPGGIKATEKGAEFLYHAHKMLEQLEEMEKIAFRETGDGIRFKLSIPRGSYIANGYTEFVSELAAEEEMEITINETGTLSTIDNVVNAGYHMGIIRYQKIYEDYFTKYLKSNRLNYEIIWEFEYVLAMSKNHPLARKETIEEADLQKFIQITHGDIEVPRTEFQEKSSQNKGERQKMIYVYERGSQFDLLTRVPETYMWVSPLPEKYLKQYHLIQRSCPVPDNRYRDVLIYRKDYQLGEIDILFQKKLYDSRIEVASAKYR